MPAPLMVAPHLRVEELFERYRRCEDVVEKSHWQVIWLKAQGTRSNEVARVTGFKRAWIRLLVLRYNEHGPEGLRDRRADNGREPILGEDIQEELLSVLSGPAPDGGLWSSPKVAQWIRERLGLEKFRYQRAWDYLQRLHFTLQRPRPRHAGASEKEQARWKKNSAASSPPSSSGTPRRRSNSGARTKRGSG